MSDTCHVCGFECHDTWSLKDEPMCPDPEELPTLAEVVGPIMAARLEGAPPQLLHNTLCPNHYHLHAHPECLRTLDTQPTPEEAWHEQRTAVTTDEVINETLRQWGWPMLPNGQRRLPGGYPGGGRGRNRRPPALPRPGVVASDVELMHRQMEDEVEIGRRALEAMALENAYLGDVWIANMARFASPPAALPG
jgi:hypothetical protein